MKSCHVVDFVGKLTERVMTPEGFLVAPAKLSRAENVQRYTAAELGLDGEGIPADRVFALYRPASEVFNADSLRSLSHKTLTLDHPPEGVSVENWPDVAVGDVGDVTQDGEHTKTVITVKHKDAIAAVTAEDGTCEMSVGYGFDLELSQGRVPSSGEAYDGIMRNIRGNHHAIVDRARGGHGCRIADKHKEQPNMATKTIVRDGFPTIEVDAGVAPIIEMMLLDSQKRLASATDSVTALTKRATDAETAVTTLTGEKTKLIADHAAKIAELEAKIPSADALVVLVRDHAGALEAARVLGSDELGKVLDGFKTAKDVRAALVADVMENRESLKPVAEGVLKAGGEVDPLKASDGSLKSVIAALLPLHAAGRSAEDGSSVSDDDVQSRNSALAGDDDGAGARKGRDGKMSGREKSMQYDYLMSRGQTDAAKKLMENC